MTAADADAVIRDANALLGAHQQIRAHSIWPEEDFPRTHTLKVKKREVIARLEADAAAARSAAPVAATGAVAARRRARWHARHAHRPGGGHRRD